jgi:hypothetical protein
MKIALVAILAAMPLKAFAQVEAGTFIALSSSQNEIVVAADSRAYSGRVESDDSCKIRAFGGKLIFAVAGDAADEHTTRAELSWDSRTIARDLFFQLSKKITVEPMSIRLATAWGNEVKSKLKAEILRDRRIISDKSSGEDLASALFASFDQNSPLIVVVHITYSLDPHGLINTQSSISNIYRSPQRIVLGHTDLGAEFGTLSTPRSRQWAESTPFSADQIATFAIRAVEFSIEYSPLDRFEGYTFRSIGGPVDAVRLSSESGVEWIKRKSNCPKD